MRCALLVSALTSVLLGCSCVPAMGQSGAGFLPDHVWPLSGSTKPDGPLSSTFGPRLLASEDLRYDFHRGIDIPTDVGTLVHATAAGWVRLAGSYSFYEDPVVQIEHTKPDGGLYYSNYLHISKALVSEGEWVETGEGIALSGASASGFAHLHFEIRDGDYHQRNCIHPFAVLPHPDRPPKIEVVDVDLTDPLLPMVHVRARLPRTSPDDDLDLDRVEVSVYRTRGHSRKLLDRQAYEMTLWNEVFTSSTGDPNLYLDDPAWNGVVVSPVRFNGDNTEYQVDFIFYDLSGDSQKDELVFVALAEDVDGNMAVASFP